MTTVRLGRSVYRVVRRQDVVSRPPDLATARRLVSSLVEGDVARLREYLAMHHELGLRPHQADVVDIAARLLYQGTYTLIRTQDAVRLVDSVAVHDLVEPLGSDLGAGARPLTPTLPDHAQTPAVDGTGGRQPQRTEPEDGDAPSPKPGTGDPSLEEPSEVEALVPLLQAEDVHFGNERVIFLPTPRGASDVPGSIGRVTGLVLTRAILEYAFVNPGKKLTFVGHADALGSAQTNLTVSRDRAENALLFVTGDRAGWATHCAGHFAVDDVQQLLTWASATWAWRTAPGEVDNVLGPKTEAALNEFRSTYNEEFSAAIPEDGSIGEHDFAAFFDLMGATLTAMLTAGMPELAALRGRLSLLDAGIVACGEGWAHEPVLMANYSCEGFRRVDVLFLDPHEVELARVESTPPLRELYGNARSVARPLGIWHLDDGVIDAFAYRREGDFVQLEFSVKGEVQKPLRVRVYEYTSEKTLDERVSAIQRDAQVLGDEPGFRKSGVFHEVEDERSIAEIAAAYGTSRSAILEHPMNAAAADALGILFVPQIDASEPVALGPVLDTHPIASDDGRPRFAAKWPVVASGYDLLHPARWLRETELGDGQGLLGDDDYGDVDEVKPVLPHFAVLDAGDRVLGVAPSPAELMDVVEYGEQGAALDGYVLLQLNGDAHVFEADAGTHILGPHGAALFMLSKGGAPWA